MTDMIQAFPDLLLQAEELCRSISFPSVQVDKIVLFGMGGSAIGGDLLKALAERTFHLPIHVVRNEEVPSYVNDKTLALIVSYSGNTEETLHAFETAVQKKHAKPILFSTGGILKEKALAHRLPYLEIPGGLMPRAALPYTFIPLIFALNKSVGFPDQTEAIHESIIILKGLREEISKASKNHDAHRLAKALRDKIPMIYSGTPAFAPAARRWKCQMNENAKQPAAFGVFPEATHNDIVGYTHPLPVHKSLGCIILRDVDESAKVKQRLEFTKKAMEKAGSQVHEVFSKGKSFLSRLLFLCYYGDFVSLFLAEEKDVDPVGIQVIDELKAELSGANR